MSKYEESINLMVNDAFKIRNRTIKTEVVEELTECKAKTAAIMAILRDAQGSQNIGNQQLAQLNDLAYKGLQKRGLQKKLDDRALKNQEYYRKLDEQVEQATKSFDFGRLREEH